MGFVLPKLPVQSNCQFLTPPTQTTASPFQKSGPFSSSSSSLSFQNSDPKPLPLPLLSAKTSTTSPMAAASETSSQYYIDVGDDTIQTLVTNSPLLVHSWIEEIEHIHRHRLNRLVVGLDVEWRPSFSRQPNPLALLQLCVGRRCLIFQLLHTPYIPNSLVDFLADVNYTFVGVGIPEDMRKLEEELDLKLSNAVDLAMVAESLYGDRTLRSAGLKTLARRVLGLELEKPRNVALNRWDNLWLSDEQIEYACADAWASFEIGRCLRAWEY